MLYCKGCGKDLVEKGNVFDSDFLYLQRLEIQTIRRLRKCNCGHRWQTFEINKEEYLKLMAMKGVV